MHNKSILIEDTYIGDTHPVFIIAEAGVSHFGSLEKAYALVDLAASAGANAFKTQFFDVEALISARESGWRNRLRPRNLSFNDAKCLKEYCKKKGIIFFATAHDETRISWIKELNLPAIKVGSGERRNVKFLEALLALQKPMIISTGMYSLDDVKLAIETCKDFPNSQLALLHCNTSYPTPSQDVNLKAMDSLKSIFSGPVGYSDHTSSHLACLAAVARGATIIERHITLDKNLPNAQDWKVSSSTDDFSILINDIREIENMLGNGIKQPSDSEKSNIHWATKSLVAARDMEIGAILKESDIKIKRPGDGISPCKLKNIIGKRLPYSIREDELIPKEVLEL